jgi:hypothetical protein
MKNENTNKTVLKSTTKRIKKNTNARKGRTARSKIPIKNKNQEIMKKRKINR